MQLTYKSEMGKYRRYYHAIGDIAKQPKPQAYTTAIFSFLVVSLFGWYAIKPTLQTILFLRREIADNKTVNVQMEDKIAKLIEAQSLYGKIQSGLPLLNQALPDDPEAVDIMSQLRNLSNVSQATISSISVAKVPLSGQSASSSKTNSEATGTNKSSDPTSLSKKKVVDLPVIVVAGGTYKTVRAFLDGIIAMRRILSIENVSIAPDLINAQTVSATGDTPLRVILKLNAHYIN